MSASAEEQISTHVTKRQIQIVLGLLWLLDGALQLQRQMFTSSFANNVIAPAAQGQPLIISGPIHFAIHILLLHPAIFDAGFVVIQLGLGVLILYKRTIRIGLIGSAIWGLCVWYMGEGANGLFSSHTLLLMGAPGAAIIYSILALSVMPKSKSTKSDDNERPAYWLPLVWAVLWVGGAVLQLLPGQNTASEVASMVSGNASASGIPGWYASLDIHAGNLISKPGLWIIVALVVIQLAIGVLVFFPGRLRKLSVIGGIIISLLFWFFGQSLGDYFSGQATDPSSGPLFFLLGIAILGCAAINFSRLRKQGFKTLEQFLT